MIIRIHGHRSLITGLLLLLAGCGGGGDENPPVSPPSPPPPPPGTLIGPTGGTVTGPSGAKVVIPAGAVAAEVRINIEQITAGAPALPAGSTVHGPMFAFTPHGTTFAVPVTMTLPFDPAGVPAGRTPAFFKTINAQTQWQHIANATFGASSVSAQVTGFSDVTVVTQPFFIGSVGREWVFNELRGMSAQSVKLNGATVSGGLLSEFRDFGPADFDAEFALIDGRTILPDGLASGAVGASEDGKTFYVAAEAPAQNASIPGVPLGSESILIQVHTFTKRTADASLTFSMPQVVIDAHDENADIGRKCPKNRVFGAEGELCLLINGRLSIDLEVFGTEVDVNALGAIFGMSGAVELLGFAESWEYVSYTNSWSTNPLWTREDFQLVTEDLNGASESHALLSLVNPATYVVDISKLEVGQAFHVRVTSEAAAFNSIAGPPSERPTSVGAYMRESLKVGGVVLEFSGLDVIDTPVPLPEPPPPEQTYVLPVGCAGGPNPAAGIIQFTAPNYSVLETGSPSTITVTRTGGSVGAVTATFTTADGSATAGADYTAVKSTVFFADGDSTPRVVRVPIIRDPAAGQPDKTVNLSLTEPGNCASVGAQSTAILTIKDAEEPPPPPEFTIGGTVTGLAGTGLVLQDLHFVPISPANGPFTFPLPTQTGAPYAVTVLTQPDNQVCAVTNGSGTVTNANITNVQVNCVTPAASGALDPAFGGTGKVSTAIGGILTDMALQSDGTLVMVGDSGSDFMLALYNADGSLDRTVSTDIAGGLDEAHGVAIQPADDKIVVVGSARVGASDDFAIVRYNADGTIDNDFGTLGKVTTDFNGRPDGAFGVAIQPDGKIVVVGNATLATGVGDFAVARYDSSGAPDTSFDSDGKVTVDIAGGLDLGRNVVLQGDKILVSGVITMGSSPVLGNAGLARFSASGALDTTFNAGVGAGRLSLPGLALGEGLALQRDGKVLLAGNASAGGSTQFALMRLDANGGADGGFGAKGLVTTPFSTRDDYGYAVAVQADDKILISGESSNLSSPDFAVARYDVSGTLDPTFDTDGKLTIDFFGSRDGARAAVIQPDGKIVLGGFALNGASVNFGLVRINP